ncbi:hypothetical protein QJS04_geneDACA005040 [Acorus gramineus]|uniref:RNA-binding protein 48 n=1 Tax=Acorus gramineus TaxID=55184 RepID=A0AAV9B0A5_ACOGR|nr:hypothetical protein QJS04_geneDACA005040 [Acorus gramineus]
MPRYRDEPPAVRVYTVCDESKYLIVRNVPALGCGDDLMSLFSTYGDVDECKPMDAEDCEPFTDVYWIKFAQFGNARFAKRKLDEFAFLGNRLQVSYAPQYESLSDTKEKLEGRRKEVLSRIGKSKGSTHQATSLPNSDAIEQSSLVHVSLQWGKREFSEASTRENPSINHVSSNKDYFPSPSMNETVRLVREKLDRIQSSGAHIESGQAVKKPRIDNRRRI